MFEAVDVIEAVGVESSVVTQPHAMMNQRQLLSAVLIKTYLQTLVHFLFYQLLNSHHKITQNNNLIVNCAHGRLVKFPLP